MIVRTFEILSVGQPKHIPVPGKAGYYKMDVAWKQDGKVGGKPFISFKEPQVFEALKQLKFGDQINVSMEKEPGSDGREYWVWKEIEKIEGTPDSTEQVSGASQPTQEVAAPATPASTGNKGFGKVTGSNYETPEERAIRRAFDREKHRQIGRQGCLNTAVNYLHLSGREFDLIDLIHIAQQLEEFVFNGKENGQESSSKETSKKSEVANQSNSVGAGQESSQQAGVLKKRGRPPKQQAEEPTDDIPF